MLLLHGFHGSADHYRGLGAHLGRDLGGVAVDLLGHGASGWPVAKYRLADFGRHALATMDDLGLDQVTVMGNSLGGAVAMWLAINAPERVRSLILLSPAGLGATTRLGAFQFVLGTLEVALGARTPVVAALSRRIQFADPGSVDAEFFEMKERDARRRRRGHERQVTLRQSAALARLHPVDPELIRQPTLIIWGDQDRALSWRRALPLIERFPDARLEVIPNCGHLPHVECPERVAELTREFLARRTG